MCGIAGIVSLSECPIEGKRIKAMCDCIAHRGPDDAGYTLFQPGPGNKGENGYWAQFVDPEFKSQNEHIPSFDSLHAQNEFQKYNFHLVLGHRRLSILDLSHHGHQPMSSSDTRYWISYNGEIYNFPELKSELTAKGHVFRTGTDTEVILALWQRYGRKSLEMLNGMFAFAIYDRLENKLTLARDRFGVKPLYYSFKDNNLIFCSEIKGIIASGLVNLELDQASLVQYFTFQNLLGKNTLSKDIRILEPGEYLTVTPGQTDISGPVRYYKNSIQVDLSLADKPKETEERLSATFQKAVERQLISDVEVGAYLSGGMDSGSIVAVAGRKLPRLLTFTGGFDLTNVNGIEQGFDERKQSEMLSYLLQTEHYEVVLHAGDMPAAMEQISWHMDDPRVGMCHQIWYAAKLASKFVKVCLSGAGGDELFGGYPWRYKSVADCVSFDEFDQRYFNYWHRMLKEDELKELFDFDVSECSPSPWEDYQNVMSEAPEYDSCLDSTENMLRRALFFEKKTFLHGLFVTEDKISMAHSLETRVPFLDNDLNELAWQIPVSLKLNLASLKANGNGHIKSNEGKLILRKAMKRFLPEEFTRQPKQGFSPPDENWFRGPSMDYIKDILLAKEARERPYLNHKTVESKLNEHFEGKKNHRLLIWSLLSLEWMQKHFLKDSI